MLENSLSLLWAHYGFTGMLIPFPSINSVSWSLNAEQSSILWMPRNPNQSDWFLRKTKPKKKERKKKNQSRVESLHNFLSFALSIKCFAWNPEIASPHSCFWKSEMESKGFGLGFLEELPEKQARKKERKKDLARAVLPHMVHFRFFTPLRYRSLSICSLVNALAPSPVTAADATPGCWCCCCCDATAIAGAFSAAMAAIAKAPLLTLLSSSSSSSFPSPPAFPRNPKEKKFLKK